MNRLSCPESGGINLKRIAGFEANVSFTVERTMRALVGDCKDLRTDRAS